MKKRSALWVLLTVGFAALPLAAPAQYIPAKTVSSSSGAGDEEGGNQFETSDRRWYISPMASYNFVDRDALLEDGIGGIFSVGKRMTGGLKLELSGTYHTFDPSRSSDSSADMTGVGVGALLSPFTSMTSLYVVTALYYGQVKNAPTTPATTNFEYHTTLWDVGAGYLVSLGNWFGHDVFLRPEARYRMDGHSRHEAGESGNGHFNDFLGNIGLLIPVGHIIQAPEQVAVVEPQAPPAPADADTDGIADDVDQCPDTPAGTPVNDKGCEADTDGDGVVDRLDKCPATPAGTPVDENGCPLPPPVAPAPEPVKGCRQPAPGEPITLEGCATGDAIVLRGVSFEFNSARLTANARVILNQVADALIAASGLQAEIGGHTDSVGSDAYNQKLSLKRARAVHDYLVARGVGPSRLKVKGYGESQPIASNDTDDGRELNRRVEMKILGEAGPGTPAPAPAPQPAAPAPANSPEGESASPPPSGQ
ncbi:MAG TPA: OmpA family protein [Candidatus Binatia bacterium]|nr:OmpA family protein [Candidatus Binatia bacterium]